MLKSCLAILIAFHGEMSGSMDEGRAVDVVYANLNKAFSTTLIECIGCILWVGRDL